MRVLQRTRWLVLVWIPLVLVAAGVLAYFAFQTARVSAWESQQSVIQSTVLLVDEKVNRIEADIIAAENTTASLVNVGQLDRFEITWRSNLVATPGIEQVLVLDAAGNIMLSVCNCAPAQRVAFERLFRDRIVADIELRQAIGSLQHVHRRYGGSEVFLGYRALEQLGGLHYVVMQHRAAHFTERTFPTLFAAEERHVRFNVVDQEGNSIYGPSLRNAGDYLVSRRFPSTLHRWRLQIAPRRAAALNTNEARAWWTELPLILVSLIVLVFGLITIVYGALTQSRLHRVRSEFVANVSHELRTPLSVIRMYAEMLESGRVKDEARQKQYLHQLTREAERLSALIENVLDFSALEKGKLSYQFRNTDVQALVERAAETFRAREESQLTVVPAEPGLAVMVDPESIMLVLLNLLDNAQKYGSAPFELRVRSGKRHVYFEVIDHGAGIAKDDLRKVFERFYRGQTSATTRGSGIGLAIVRQIVEAHGGKAWADRLEPAGTRFTFSLPLTEPNGQTPNTTG